MDHLFSFEKLDVYQLSRKFVKKIYEISNHFPDEEKFGITSQMRRAAVSVLANMAEGSAREGGKAQAMFTTYSYSSLMEVLNWLILSCDLDLLSVQEYQGLRTMIFEISNKLNALRKSQQNVKRTN